MAALSCPSCGAVHEPVNPGIVVIVCDQCRTTLYREADVLRAGRESIVAEPQSRIAVGRAGAVGDRRVEVLGRVQLRHATGHWDEWFVRDTRGAVGWLVEDGKRYALERAISPAPAVDPDLRVGQTLTVEGVTYEVREVGEAICVGGEGQLPRAIEVGALYRYADCAEIDGDRLLLIELSADGAVEAFVGTHVPAEWVIFAPGAEAPPPAQAETASTIRCAQCGAPFELPTQGEPAATAGCPYCDAVLELDGAAARVVGHRHGRPDFDLELGDRGDFRGHRWEVVGRIRYAEGRYTSHEYLLWSADGGYLWLEKDDGHWSYLKPVASGPALKTVARCVPKEWVRAGEGSYRFFTSGEVVLEYVDGALPWRATVGDRTRYWELVNAPHRFSIEGEKTEIEHFQGRWVPGDALLEVFGRGDRWRRPVEVHPAQPNPFARWMPLAIAAGLLTGLNLFIAATTFVPGETLMQTRLGSTADGQLSPPFIVREDQAGVMAFHYEAPVDNSWVWIDVELVDALDDDEPIAATGTEVGYYHGYEGGEYWSEGSTHGAQYFKTLPPGTYRLDLASEYDKPVMVDVKVTAGERLARYNLLLAAVLALVAALVPVSYFGFEARRWEDVLDPD